MKSLTKRASQMVEKPKFWEMSKRGQLEVGAKVIAGILSIVFLLSLALVFQNQIFTSVPIPAGSFEGNASNLVRGNAASAFQIAAGGLPTWMNIAIFVVIVILLVFAYNVYRQSNFTGTGSY